MANDAFSDWVPVLAPPSLAARFLREVATWVELEDGNGGPRDWGDASDSELAAFFGEASVAQWELLKRLSAGASPMPAADLAEALGVAVTAVAGLVGPLNKRARRLDWVPPLTPQSFSRGARADRGLLLHPALRSWVAGQADAQGT
jgi:hypothetical protein